MKRVLAFLALVAVLFLAGSCNYEVNLSVEASAELYYDIEPLPVSIPWTLVDRTFHSEHFSDSDLEYIFASVTKGAIGDYRTAVLNLKVSDKVSGKFLRNESYGVIINGSGGFDFADLSY